MDKKKYFNGQKIIFGVGRSGRVSISIEPLINGRSFDNYVYSNEKGAKIATMREKQYLKRIGKNTCKCGRVIKDSQ